MPYFEAARWIAAFATIGLAIGLPLHAEAGDETFRIAGAPGEPALQMRHVAPTAAGPGGGRPVLSVHGQTFPSGLAAAFRFDGRSWLDELAAAGFDAWAFDFAGYGGSDRYAEMSAPPDAAEPLGRAPEGAHQIERVVHAILERSRAARVSIVAHSWGTVATGRFAGDHPELVDRLVFFGPIARRDGSPAAPLDAWRFVTVAEQWQRFTQDVPKDHLPVLLPRHFEAWAPAYLASDPTSGDRTPPSVATPNGPLADIKAAWAGQLAYDPRLIRAPVALIHGEWDSVSTDPDNRWLFDALVRAPLKRDIRISEATHLINLEEARYALYRAAESFLRADDTPPVSADGVP